MISLIIITGTIITITMEAIGMEMKPPGHSLLASLWVL